MKINELRNLLFEDLQNLREGKITPAYASAVSNLNGKIIASVAMELKYNMFLEKRKTIPFLEPTPQASNPTDQKQLSADPIRLEGSQTSKYFVTMYGVNEGYFVLVLADNTKQVLEAMNQAYGKGNWTQIYTEEEFASLQGSFKQLTEIIAT